MPIALAQRTRRKAVTAASPLVCAAVLALGLTVPPTAVQLLADTKPVIMTGTFTSRPGQQYVDMAMDNYITPTHVCDPAPCNYATPYPLTTPEQAWPITGLFDYTFGRSVAIGLADLEGEIDALRTDNVDQPIVIFGYSQSAVISTEYKRGLAEQYPGADNPDAPDISFVLIGNLNRPNGGVMTRFQGAYIPFINFYFNGPAPTDTSFKTVDIARQYDGFADFPLYPLNLVSTANALFGILYVHTDYQATTLAPTPPADAEQGTFGDTAYYLIPTEHLPLLQPLRDLGAPEPLVALFEPMLRVIVELGYDREIGPWVPTGARLFAPIDIGAVADDLAQAWGRGVDDALDEIANPTPPQPGPTPTERVITDLVRLNITHTVDALTGGPQTSSVATESVASEPEPAAEVVVSEEESEDPEPSSIWRPTPAGVIGSDKPSEESSNESSDEPSEEPSEEPSDEPSEETDTPQDTADDGGSEPSASTAGDQE